MPDLFDATPSASRDARFNDFESMPASPTPSPVEPYLSESAEIPIAPTLRKPKHTRMHIFTSYCEIPPNVTFENQEDGEKILLFLRKSLITNIMWMISSAILVLLPMLLLLASSILSQFPMKFVAFAVLLYYLLVASYIFVNFITWYFNIILVTDRRIVDVDFEDLVYKDVAETKLSLVQDVKYTQTGAIRTIFDYGDVLIQTAGTIDNFDLHAMPLPERVVNVIEDLIGKGERHV